MTFSAMKHQELLNLVYNSHGNWTPSACKNKGEPSKPIIEPGFVLILLSPSIQTKYNIDLFTAAC